MGKYKSGEAIIEILNGQGVDKVFINPGFEHNAVQVCIAQARLEGRKAPQLVLCLDEAVTASAAYGNYMVTGKPQVVLVHSELGSLQLGGNLQNLQWGRVPAVILAAYQEIDVERTLWDGRPYDQGSIVRNSVKFDRRLDGGEDLHEVMAEAFRIARTEPTGPVYLCFPMDYLSREIERPDGEASAEGREGLGGVMSQGIEGPGGRPVIEVQGIAKTITEDELAEQPRAGEGLDGNVSQGIGAAGGEASAAPAPLQAVDIETLGKMADILLEAKNPMLVSGNAGRYHNNVTALVDLAESLGASVLTGYSWMNFPSDHPLCIGIEQIGGSRKKDAGFDEADVILAIDYDMPYVRSAPELRPDVTILHIDVDPLTQGRLLWGRGADIFMKADSREAIPALTELLKSRMAPDKKAELEERSRRIAARNEGIRRGWREAAEGRQEPPLSADYLFFCLNELIDEDTIVINHTLSHCASVTEQIVRTKPGTWFGCPSGAIGWAPGAALGAASASPGTLVVAIMTDGGFIWGCPTAALWASSKYRFPFLAIICNNSGYSEVRKSQKRMTGDDGLGEQFFAESAADFQPRYALTAQGAGAFGRTVKTSEDVLPALREALGVVRSGRPAVLDVHLPGDK